MRKRIKAILIVFVLMLSIFSLPIQAYDSGYYINKYTVKAILHEDNTVSQTETIQVHFNEPRHGIYRSIPESFEVGYGKGSMKTDHYATKVKNISVKNDEYDVDSDDGYTNIKIGDEDKTITGDHTYTISFTYVMPEDYRDNTDIIFYSLLGSQWDTSINHFSFDMKFEKPLTQHEVNSMHLYSGSFGNENNALNVDYSLTKNGISGQADYIAPQQAITIFGYVRQGYFVGAASVPTILPYIFAAISIVLGVYVLFLELFKKHKDIVETIEFYPPDDLDSAQVGYIVDESADMEDMMSLIPYWANKGYITIEDLDEKTYTIKKLKDLPKTAPMHQKTLFNAFFTKKETERKMNSLSSDVVRALDSSKSELTTSFFKETQLSQWDGKGLCSLIIAIACFILMCITRDRSIAADKWMIVGPFFLSLIYLLNILIVLGIGIKGAAKERFSSKVKNIISLILRCVLLLFGVYLMHITYIIGDSTEYSLSMQYVLTVLLVLSIDSLLIRRLNTPTEYWQKIAGRLMGFKTFIKKAEIPQLEKLSKENPNYFFDVIPYAMVFGLSESWCKRFENISLEKPDWCTGSSTYVFNSMMYYSMMDHAIMRPVSHAVHEYSASSSSSGGFSGGGGGGGGGGSW